MSASIVIPAYNAAAFITRAIESALAQTQPPLEVIVVDDVSTDDTVAVVTRLAARHPELRLLTSERNGGPAAARNLGIGVARGDWIAILDADDAFEPGRLEALTELGAQQHAAMVADDIVYYDAVAKQVARRGLNGGAPFEIDLESFLLHNVGGRAMDWGLLKPVIRRAFLESTGVRYRPDARHGEDFLFVVDLLAAGAHYVCNPGYGGYLYTERHGSISRTGSGMSRTTVDYESQQRAALALAQDPRFASQPRIAELLRQRADGMARTAQVYAKQQAVNACMAKRQPLRLLGLALGDRDIAQMAARSCARSLLGLLGVRRFRTLR